MTKSTATPATERSEETMPRLPAELIEPWTDSTSKMTSVAFDWGAEALRFAGQRLERTRNTVAHLPKCGSWDEVVRLQMDWTSALMQDYLEESRHFFEFAQKASADAASSKRGNGQRKAS